MQQELLILYLQYPLWEEEVVFQWKAGNQMVRDYYLKDALFTMIYSPCTCLYRLVLLSVSHSVSVTVELPEDSFADGAIGGAGLIANLGTWFVDIGTEGTTVVKQCMGSGFLPLDALDAKHETHPILTRLIGN